MCIIYCMVLQVFVDNRESALISQLDSSFDFLIQPLELGDVLLTDEEHGLALVFERKTLSDLAASIKDGRYKEQKHRLLANYPAHRITYIVEEGHILPKDAHGLKKSVYFGIYAHSMYRDGVHVVFTKNIQETALFIHDVATKCKENPGKFKAVEGDEGDYIHSRKAKCRKIDNIDPIACYKLQLCQVPGISYKLAEGIIEKFPTLMSFMQHLSTFTNQADAIKTIAKLPLIGAKKAATIVGYLRPDLVE